MKNYPNIFVSILLLTLASCDISQNIKNNQNSPVGPIMISTWDAGKDVNKIGWEVLSNNGLIIDAIEKGGNYMENQINCCVGLGGNPDRDGFVTLDASIMDYNGMIGSVAALERIKYPISVARKVMEETPHVMLVGEGAQDFALTQGFELESGELSENAKEEYEKWLIKSEYKPKTNIENMEVPTKLSNGDYNHDTMAMIGKDSEGNLGGGVTTSGMGFKMRGRVGDSPIIGAGLYVANEVGAATSSGMGEEVIRNVGSHLVVELMRQGMSPAEACKAAVLRIINKREDKAQGLQVGFIALNKAGEYGAYAVQKGFTYAVKSGSVDSIFKSPSFYN